jgi:hypothetical protein
VRESMEDKYYFWTSGFDAAGIVKAANEKDAEHKVRMSQNINWLIYVSVEAIDNMDLDGYDVTKLISF